MTTDFRRQVASLVVTVPLVMVPGTVARAAPPAGMSYGCGVTPYTWVVPSGVTEVTASLYGGQGAGGVTGRTQGKGGTGAVLVVELAVTAGASYEIFVGCAGGERSTQGPFAGGSGGASGYVAGANGGAGTGIRSGQQFIAVAGGGGGGGGRGLAVSNTSPGDGGKAGSGLGPSGASPGEDGGRGRAGGGTGGGVAQTIGGFGGDGIPSQTSAGGGGGGGGGYVGGGGGGAGQSSAINEGGAGGGGGAGTSYAAPGVIVQKITANNKGDGGVVLVYGD